MRDRRNQAIAALTVITLVLCVYALMPAGNRLAITVMDVGEGLCVVMRTPDGRTMVMDCGTSSWRSNDGVGESVVLPYLKKSGARHIDLAILSHPHDDHVSGLAGLLRKCPPKLVMDPGADEQSWAYSRFLQVVRKSGATYRVAERGQVVELGESVRIQVLSPQESANGVELNDRSVVLRVIYGKTAFLLTGDAEADLEEEMLSAHQPVRAQMLLVGHHGSAGASSPEWLGAVKPQVAVISCGRRNTYGHPARQTLDRLESCGARVYRTDQDGAVTFTSDGDTISVSKMVQRR